MNTKTYKYDLSKFRGYRKIKEKSIFSYFLNIKYNGFEIVASSYDTIEFKIDNQLFRKLKLLKLNNEIKFNSIEYRLINLIDSSDDISNKSDDFYDDFYNNKWYIYSNDYYYDDFDLNSIKNDKKNILNHHSNKFNQKFKTYKK